MGLCEKCILMREDYDSLNGLHDDVIDESGDIRQKHYCPAYEDYIPYGIYYDGAECEYFIEKNGN